MRKTMLAFVVFTLALTPLAFASQDQRTDQQVFNDIAKAVNRYSFFTIFDDVNVDVTNGVATLTGKVTQPFKSGEIAKRAAKVAGVHSVVNQIVVLPLSGFDDSLRYRIARSIYGNQNFWNYAVMAYPPIHIVVDRGRVTLTGVVQSDVDRAIARSLATFEFGVFSVTNELKTAAEMKALRATS
ncbi:MAG: BON domain-containing protein [Vicinamibacterales bacterium]